MAFPASGSNHKITDTILEGSACKTTSVPSTHSVPELLEQSILQSSPLSVAGVPSECLTHRLRGGGQRKSGFIAMRLCWCASHQINVTLLN